MPIDCACSLDATTLEPCTIVIFGASGDLTTRKLGPALFSLHRHGLLPERLAIVGAGRTRLTDQEFRELLRAAIPEAEGPQAAEWLEFADLLSYCPVEYEREASFADLAAYLTALDQRRHTGGNRIFYLATPPTMYGPIGRSLGVSGLAAEAGEGRGWSRLVVEKPFGRDLTSAIALDHLLHQSFAESRIFRIDHYLAKETVQNVLMLRFANSIFEPIWNRGHIEYIGIMASEELGVEHRAGYYDQAGVIRDMFQNHMMQLLALTSMEPPSWLHAERVREEKLKVFRSLKPYAAHAFTHSGQSLPEGGAGSSLPADKGGAIILGQYGAGEIRGRSVPAYRDEPGVAPGSRTPTFAMTRLFIDNWRWQGVPFYLVSGKRLAAKQTKIVVQFKEVPHSMFDGLLAQRNMEERITANRLVIGIHPRERISLRFQAKGQGPKLCVSPVTMDFAYPTDQAQAVDSYQKVLLDCITGDQMLFWDKSGIELSWAFLDPVLSLGASSRADETVLPYPAGSWGPEAAWPWMGLLLD
jgi:glucose-6-phosphate 1-dehydrogenase